MKIFQSNCQLVAMKISQSSCQAVAMIFPQLNILTLKVNCLGWDLNSRTLEKTNQPLTCLNQLSYWNRQERDIFFKAMSADVVPSCHARSRTPSHAHSRTLSLGQRPTLAERDGPPRATVRRARRSAEQEQEKEKNMRLFHLSANETACV